MPGQMRRRPFFRSVFQRVTKIGYYGVHNELSGWVYGKDIAVPMYHTFHSDPRLARARWLERLASAAQGGFASNIFFHGQIVAGKQCSPGIRPWLERYMDSCPAPRCTSDRSAMNASVFALCPAGWACWSTRLYHAIASLTIPVVLANGAVQPFDSMLDWSTFTLQPDTDTVLAHSAAGPTDPLAQLHGAATEIRAACMATRTSRSAAEVPPSCANHPAATMIRTLDEVRPWFMWNPKDNRSAYGLFLLELHCRKLKWEGNLAAEAVCLKVFHNYDVAAAALSFRHKFVKSTKSPPGHG